MGNKGSRSRRASPPAAIYGKVHQSTEDETKESKTDLNRRSTVAKATIPVTLPLNGNADHVLHLAAQEISTGNDQFEDRDYLGALRCYENGLRMAEQYGGILRYYYEVVCMGNIGVVEFIHKNYTRAQEYFSETLKIIQTRLVQHSKDFSWPPHIDTNYVKLGHICTCILLRKDFTFHHISSEYYYVDYKLTYMESLGDLIAAITSKNSRQFVINYDVIFYVTNSVNLGACCEMSKRHKEALRIYNEASINREKLHGAFSLQVCDSLISTVQCMYSMHMHNTMHPFLTSQSQSRSLDSEEAEGKKDRGLRISATEGALATVSLDDDPDKDTKRTESEETGLNLRLDGIREDSILASCINILHKCIDICIIYLPPAHIDTAIAYNNLGVALVQRGGGGRAGYSYTSIHRYFTKSLEIRKGLATYTGDVVGGSSVRGLVDLCGVVERNLEYMEKFVWGTPSQERTDEDKRKTWGGKPKIGANKSILPTQSSRSLLR